MFKIERTIWPKNYYLQIKIVYATGVGHLECAPPNPSEGFAPRWCALIWIFLMLLRVKNGLLKKNTYS